MEYSFITPFTNVGCDLCWKSWTLVRTCVGLLIKDLRKPSRRCINKLNTHSDGRDVGCIKEKR